VKSRSEFDVSDVHVSQQVSRNIELMDLAGTFVDTERPDVAIETLDPATLDIALAAEDLHHAISHPSAHLGRVIFAHRDVHRDVLAAITLARCFQDQGAGCLRSSA
jgi:hypothetical protein